MSANVPNGETLADKKGEGHNHGLDSGVDLKVQSLNAVDDVDVPNAPVKDTNAKVPTYPKAKFNLLDRYIDDPRPLSVAIIGGGLAGITAGCLLPKKVPGIKLTIFEKNKDFVSSLINKPYRDDVPRTNSAQGGTWYENIYPGVRCDIPSHVYQSTFSPKTDWSDEFAHGAEIRDYWQDIARKFDVYQYAKFGTKVEDAAWDATKSVWRLSVRNLDTGEVFTAEADFVLSCIGRFNEWKLPKYPGISEYKGLLRHASHWNPDFDPTGKTVAVIGNGASGIQLVANLQKSVAKLDHYARSKTWIAASWAGDERTLEPQPISEERKESFQDPKAYLTFRKEMEDKYWRRFGTFLKGNEGNQKMRDDFTDIMGKRLAKKPELAKEIVPDFSPNCRRLTPGPGYLEAISEGNVDYIRTPIKRFTETGIETTDGIHREVDAVFCATGANGDMVHPFPIRANGQELASVWSPDGEHGAPYTYMGLATPGFPNFLFVHGPHGTGPSGTVPQSVESQLTYFAKLLRKASREGIKTMTPTKRATDDFVDFCDAFFNTTVMTDGCSSWYNGGRPGGRIHGMWPGSALHLTHVRREPRWEDWEYEYLDESGGNSLLWYFGNGWTRAEQDPDADMTSYLRVPGETDLREVHESWWSLP